MSRDFGILMPKHFAGQWRVNSNKNCNNIIIIHSIILVTSPHTRYNFNIYKYLFNRR